MIFLGNIDTRNLIIRNIGCMNGMITTTKYENLDEVMKRIHMNFKVTGLWNDYM